MLLPQEECYWEENTAMSTTLRSVHLSLLPWETFRLQMATQGQARSRWSLLPPSQLSWLNLTCSQAHPASGHCCSPSIWGLNPPLLPLTEACAGGELPVASHSHLFFPLSCSSPDSEGVEDRIHRTQWRSGSVSPDLQPILEQSSHTHHHTRPRQSHESASYI